MYAVVTVAISAKILSNSVYSTRALIGQQPCLDEASPHFRIHSHVLAHFL